MLTVAYDINGKRYYAANFKSQAEAHSKKYFDNYGRPVTPVISDSKTPHFRYYENSGHGGEGNNMTILHKIAQNRIMQCFNEGSNFFVYFWERFNEPGNPKHCRYKKIDLKKHYCNAQLESSVGSRLADIRLNPIDKNMPPILIEIAVFHLCEFAKIEEGHLIIEIRIRDFKELSKLLNRDGIYESFLTEKTPKVRFWNFPRDKKALPWK